MEHYSKYFKDPLFECSDCKACSKKSVCFQENLAVKCDKMKEATRKFNETCPANSKPTSGGACARVQADGKLGAKIQNVCNIGYKWDGSAGKCISHVEDKKK